MAEMDWKKLVGNIAPTLGTMLLGPLGGTAVSVLSNIFLGKENGSESEVSAAVLAGMTPDKIVEMKRIDKEHELKMTQLNIDLVALNQTLEIAYVDDTKDARKYQSNNTFWLGIAILMLFSITMAMSLYGAYQILLGGITIKDVSVVAAISGFIGSIIGYIASSAQQVIGFFYGSSAGSKQKSDAMGDAINKIKLK